MFNLHKNLKNKKTQAFSYFHKKKNNSKNLMKDVKKINIQPKVFLKPFLLLRTTKLLAQSIMLMQAMKDSRSTFDETHCDDALNCIAQCFSPRPFFLCIFTFVKNTFDASYFVTMLHLFKNVYKVLCHDLLVLIKLPIPPLRDFSFLTTLYDLFLDPLALAL
jgi:hypothetical protein